MSACMEPVDVLTRLLECEEKKKSAVLARQPEKLAEIAEMQRRLLTALKDAGSKLSGGGSLTADGAEAMERTLAALQRLCSTNRLLLEELLCEVEVCLSLLEGGTATYDAGREPGRPKKSVPAVCDIRA
ncbi:MAG: hypothetical protein ACOYEP_10965 [Limnochordia bacterium]|jgi:hypothetical protein